MPDNLFQNMIDDATRAVDSMECFVRKWSDIEYTMSPEQEHKMSAILVRLDELR